MKKLSLLVLSLIFSTTALAGFQGYNGTTDLKLFNKLQCSTGLTCTRVGGTFKIVSSPTISTGALSITGAEAGDATLTMAADESDDSGDDWLIKSAASGNAFTISNDTSGSQVAKLTLSTAAAMTSVVSITGTGAGALSGYLQSQVASTTTTITAAQCGSTFVSNSADVMTLPEASTVLGCRLTFVCGTADDFDINPNDGTDQIGPVNSAAANAITTLAPAAGDAIRCTDIGSSITLEAVGANLWSSIGIGNGPWTDVN